MGFSSAQPAMERIFEALRALPDTIATRNVYNEVLEAFADLDFDDEAALYTDGLDPVLDAVLTERAQRGSP